jgi:hypothetical protein
VKFDDDNMARNLMIEKTKIQRKDKRTLVGVFKRNKQKNKKEYTHPWFKKPRRYCSYKKRLGRTKRTLVNVLKRNKRKKTKEIYSPLVP